MDFGKVYQILKEQIRESGAREYGMYVQVKIQLVKFVLSAFKIGRRNFEILKKE